MCVALKGKFLVAKRKKATTLGVVARIAAVGCASLIAVGCVGFGIAAAGAGANAGTFGLSSLSTEESGAKTSDSYDSPNALLASVSEGASESVVLASTAKRDVSQGYDAIVEIEEAERRAAEEQARREQAEREAKAAEARAAGMAASLPEVDWSVGKEAFIAEWTERINNYLAGSPLAGYGATFATAAWTYGVDPRWSPAISNTESTKGRNCFRTHNAWGWMGDTSWGSWEEAINAHVKGLAEGYGYSISVTAAKKYCPPTYMSWYEKTISQMALI